MHFPATNPGMLAPAHGTHRLVGVQWPRIDRQGDGNKDGLTHVGALT